MYKITLEVSEEQEDAIKAFFIHSNWDFKKVCDNKTDKAVQCCPDNLPKEQTLKRIVQKKRGTTCKTGRQSQQTAKAARCSSLSKKPQLEVPIPEGGSSPHEEPPHEGPSAEDNKCPHCFFHPCVAQANSTAPWLGHGQAPCERNASIRKDLYRRFWKCLANVGGWLIPEYLTKKSVTGGGDWIVMHRREIMPECVLKLVRNRYPNPKGIAYMGHMWE